MTVLELKKYIFQKGKIEFILNEIGCGHILYHPAKEYYSCTNCDGDNKTAINIKNNEYLGCKNYTREKYLLICFLCTVLLQNVLESCSAACVTAAYRNGFFLCFFYCAVYHFVGNGTGEQDHQIRHPDLFLHGSFFLGKNFRLASEAFADILILTYHSFITAYNYNAHNSLSFDL